MTHATAIETDWALLPGDHPQWYLDAYPLSYAPKTRVRKGPLSAAEFASEVGAGNGIKETIIYVHVPFCKSPCGYCVLVKRTYEPALAGAFLKALHTQIGMMADRHLTGDIQCTGVSFGGGTPTTLAADDLVRLFHTFPQVYPCSADFKCTVEANPATCNLDYLKALYQGGIRRISFGMQTFDPQRNKILQCGHTVDQGRQAVRDARKAGFSNINIDMLYGLPGQRPADLVQDLEDALKLDLECYTFYPLAVYPGSKLNGKIKANQAPPLPPRDIIDEMTGIIESRFMGAGYQRSWLNQYIRADRFQRHGGLSPVNYLALGSGAYGTLHGWSYFNHPGLDEYIKQTERSLLPFLYRAKISDLEWAVRKFYDAYLCLKVVWRDFSDNERRILRPLLDQYSSRGLWKEDGETLIPTALGRQKADGFIQMLLMDSINRPRQTATS